MKCIKCEHDMKSHKNGCQEIEGMINGIERLCLCDQTVEKNDKQFNKNRERKPIRIVQSPR